MDPEHAVVLTSPSATWDPGAPCPIVIADEHRSFLAYHEADPGPAGHHAARLIEFAACRGIRTGGPSDETFAGHPLHGKGLQFYALHEIKNSSWLAAQRAINRAHPVSPALPWPHARHFMLAFHDSTIEAIADSIELLDAYPTLDQAAAAALRLLRE